MRAARQVIAAMSACLCLQAAWTPIACANPHLAVLEQQFSRGEYSSAASAAEKHGDADMLAFAARSLLAMAMTGDRAPDPAIIARAAQDAEAALRIDPAHEEARLQLAIALSLKGRAASLMEAWNAGYGQRGKDLARTVLKQDPDNYYAHGFLAVWNLEVRRRGGKLGGNLMGASIDDARRHYQHAVRLAPDDIGVQWQWARALIALDPRRYGAEAADALGRAMSANADDHVERVMQARAEKLATVLKSDARAAQTLALDML